MRWEKKQSCLEKAQPAGPWAVKGPAPHHPQQRPVSSRVPPPPPSFTFVFLASFKKCSYCFPEGQLRCSCEIPARRARTKVLGFTTLSLQASGSGSSLASTGFLHTLPQSSSQPHETKPRKLD